ncbi:hypothetical protein CBW16_03665 [Flavobacteriaceae bacterium JJC]|nr:hypothetical protein CBW16_03665 [Flavobacteriaceae bacterium JJC]
MKLSIIIPVYNSEKYLQRCLESVFGQDLPFSDYEVIVINDGSKDESKNIILHFKNQFENLLLIDQPNRGVSAARNAGLALAKGDYITFIDSDDYLVKDSLKSVVCYLEENQLDVLYCKIEVVQENGTPLYFMADTGKEGEILDGFSHPRRTYPAVFYRREILRGLRFHEGISIGEDSLFNAMAQSFARRVSFFAIPYYCYRDTPNSLSAASDNERKVSEMYLATTLLLHFQSSKDHKKNPSEIKYFEVVVKIFLTRVIQWGVLIKSDKTEFLRLHQFARENKIIHLLNELSEDYPFMNKSFYQFYVFQKYSRLKNIILQKLPFSSKIQ